METKPNSREIAARVFRDKLYGPSTDAAWDACKIHWLAASEFDWLVAQCRKEGLL